MNDQKRRIVHVFIGESSISLMVIENIIRYSAFDNFFIVTKKADTVKYRELFAKCNTTSFVFCDEITPSRFSKIITQVSSVILGRFSTLFTFFPYDEIRTLLRHRHDPILLHGLSYSFLAHLLLLNHFPSLSYVCWGGAPKPVGKRIRDKLLFLAGQCIFRGFKRIVCLITADKEDFEKAYGITSVTTLIYQSDILHFDDTLAWQVQVGTDRRNVLLGNSACYTDSYLKLLPALESIAAPVSITCMMSYPDGDPDGMKRQVIDRFTSAFGEAFTPWTQQLDFKGYSERLKQHDIYICGEKRQAGVCAIYVMLMYGKKVYLAGKNLAWIRENKFIVHDVKQLETETSETFLQMPTQEERQYNHSRILELLSPATLAKDWDLFYSQL